MRYRIASTQLFPAWSPDRRLQPLPSLPSLPSFRRWPLLLPLLLLLPPAPLLGPLLPMTICRGPLPLLAPCRSLGCRWHSQPCRPCWFGNHCCYCHCWAWHCPCCRGAVARNSALAGPFVALVVTDPVAAAAAFCLPILVADGRKLLIILFQKNTNVWTLNMDLQVCMLQATRVVAWRRQECACSTLSAHPDPSSSPILGTLDLW